MAALTKNPAGKGPENIAFQFPAPVAQKDCARMAVVLTPAGHVWHRDPRESGQWNDPVPPACGDQHKWSSGRECANHVLTGQV